MSQLQSLSVQQVLRETDSTGTGLQRGRKKLNNHLWMWCFKLVGDVKGKTQELNNLKNIFFMQLFNFLMSKEN